MLYHMFQIRYVFIPLPTDLYALFIFPRKNADLREIVAKGANLEDFRRAVVGLRERYLPFHTGDSEFELPEELEIFNLDHPPWICQPYVRPAPEVYLEKMRKIAEEEKKEREEQKKAVPLDENKRSAEDDKGEPVLSKTKRKKLERKTAYLPCKCLYINTNISSDVYRKKKRPYQETTKWRLRGSS